MFRIDLENIKSKFKKETENNNKRKIENLVVFLVLLIITVIAINIIWGDKKEDVKAELKDGCDDLLALVDAQVVGASEVAIVHGFPPS